MTLLHKFVFAGVALTTGSAFATTRATPEILNGSIATDHPEVGRIDAKLNAEAYICTGTLIGAHTVTTAAHCVVGNAGINIAFGTASYFVSAAVANPSYTHTAVSTGDLAVLTLSSDVRGIEPAVIAPDTLAPFTGQAIQLYGFGQTGSTDETLANLNHGDNTIGSLDPMQFSYTGATGDLSNICHGDSGGPTFATVNNQIYAIGIHSAGTCSATTPDDEVSGIDTRVDQYADWIAQNAGGDVYAPGGPRETAAPTVTVTPATLTATTTFPTTLAVHATDEFRLTELKVLVDGEAVDSKGVSGLTADWTATIPAMKSGAHTITVQVFDGTATPTTATLETGPTETSAPASGCSYGDGGRIPTNPISLTLAGLLGLLAILLRRP